MAKKKIEAPEANSIILPLLALNNTVLTPGIPQPLKIENENQKLFLDSCVNANTEVVVATIISKNDGKPEILKKGLLCFIDRILQMPGAPTVAFVRPVHRVNILNNFKDHDFETAEVSILKDITLPKDFSKDTTAILDHIRNLFNSTLQFIVDTEKITAEKIVEENSSSPLLQIYAMSHVAPIPWEDKYKVLECSSFNKLINTFSSILDINYQKIQLQAQIHERTHRELGKQQKDLFLRTLLQQVKDEIGENEEGDIADFLIKAANKNLPPEAKQHFDKELHKLERLNINNPEYSVQYSYLEAFLDLPWNNYNNSDISLEKVEKILNRDHYGLEKVKERILEYMAVVKLRNDLKAPIICLYGPPGVGKTSIGKSVAEATGREYARIALGGMHDEAEIRGHRRTYIGAMPGRFLHTMSKLKFGNPLILLDEIDKVGQDYKGDPSSALLEALDPEQNNTFHDNFIDYPYDLSKVLFIATANDLSSIPPPLRDRMEIIEMKGYTADEKREIAMRHLIEKANKDNGINPNEGKYLPEAIDLIISKFTHEKGVRQLSMALNRIARKLAFLKVKGKKLPEVISPEIVKSFLDKKDIQNNSVGFATL